MSLNLGPLRDGPGVEAARLTADNEMRLIAILNDHVSRVQFATRSFSRYVLFPFPD